MDHIKRQWHVSAHDLDRLRQQVDWQALFVGLGLKRAEQKSKPHDWWAFSPFHEEQTPSFHMGPGGLWYDFSIGEGGGSIELVQRLRSCDCYEAARIMLAEGWCGAAPILDDESGAVHQPAQRALRSNQPVRRVTQTVRRSAQGAVSVSTIGNNTSDFEPVGANSPRTKSARRSKSLPCRNSGRETVTHFRWNCLNAPIRQDLIKLTTGHRSLDERGLSPATCDLLGIGYLPQGRSPLKGRIVFQVADARRAAEDIPPEQLQRKCVTVSRPELRPGNDFERVILSHLGRAVKDGQEPKYLFYEGFHKSAELYGQELIWLHEDAAAQIIETGHILLTEGPFDVAKAVEAGLRNVVGSFGATLSGPQAMKLKAMTAHFGIDRVLIVYDRDEPGKRGALKAQSLLKDLGLKCVIFDWDAPIARTRSGPAHIPDMIGDLADFSAQQLHWLRQRGRL